MPAQNRQDRPRALPLLGLLLLHSACPGDVESKLDRGPAVDLWVFAEPPPAESSAGDAIRADATGQTDTLDLGLGPCNLWSAWTCAAGNVKLCEASCQTYALSCTTSGDCVCGVSRGTCGPFSAPPSAPCDACRQAVAAGCCAP